MNLEAAKLGMFAGGIVGWLVVVALVGGKIEALGAQIVGIMFGAIIGLVVGLVSAHRRAQRR
jgi:hypothetical protein